MNRRDSEHSFTPTVNSATGFITPQGSISEPNHHQPGTASGAGASAQTAPAYSENPYSTNHTYSTNRPYSPTNPGSPRSNYGPSSGYSSSTKPRYDDHGSIQTAYHDPDAQPTAPATDPEAALPRTSQSSRPQSTTTSIRNKGFTGSLKSYFRRNSQSSNHSRPKDHDDNQSRKSTEKKEEETHAEIEHKMEDPQHLLNTILEEPEEDAMPLIPVSDAVINEAVAAHTGEAPAEVKQRRQGYRENLMRQRKLRKYSKASRSIATLRRAYNRFVTFSLFTRIFVYWLPLAIILFIPLACGFWRNTDLQVGGTKVSWLFVWLEVVWGALFIGKLFAHYMPEIVGFLLSIFMPQYFRYVDMFCALELPVQLIIWTFVTFISFPPILTANSLARDKDKHPHQPHWQQIVQDVCVALLVSAIVFFVEQVFIYVLSANFHRTRMTRRIDHQKKSVNVLIILLDKAYSYFPYQCDEFDEEDESLRYATLKRATKRVGNMNSKNKVFNKVKNTVNNAARNVGNVVADVSAASGQQDSQPSTARIVKNALTNRETREILANRIWKSLVMEDSNALTYEDMLGVFGKDKKEEVLFMFDILDSNGQDGIDLDEMVDSVNRIGRESKSISKSLVDMDGAITKLHHLLMCLALILIVVIFVGMLAPSSATVLATLGSTLLSFSFMFSATAQEVFQSCVFLFVKHPYDVGDWIQTSVPSVGLVRMQVLELALMYSVFAEIGIGTRRQVSNSVLNSQFVDNITRSGPSQIAINLVIGIPETTQEQLEEFETRMNEFVDANPRDYCPGVFFQAVNQTDLDRLTLTVCVNTRNSQEDIVLFSNRRTRALEFIGQCIHEIPISIPHREDVSFHDPTLPIFEYQIKDIDEAMQFVEKSKGKRRTFGMLPPDYEDEKADSVAVTEVAGDPGYVDHPHNATMSPGGHHDPSQPLRRQFSTSSRASHASRAFSNATRSSQTFGLRSRSQKPKPPSARQIA